MPSLKCCRTGDSGGDDDEGSRNRKRRKDNNKNEGVLPAASARRSRRRCNSVQWDGEEAKSKMKESSNRVQEVINAQSPLVRTSRGRRPSNFMLPAYSICSSSTEKTTVQWYFGGGEQSAIVAVVFNGKDVCKLLFVFSNGEDDLCSSSPMEKTGRCSVPTA
nr:Histone-lysine N-methyltransferase [Ipomoea batatas]